MLELRDVTWGTPDGENILNGINLTVPDGKLVVVTGPNGGGKTTLAKMIAGLETPDSGQILMDGQDITRLDVTQRARLGMAYAFQQPVRFKGVSVRTLLELAAGEHGKEQSLCDMLSKVGLCAREYIDREVDASLSGGEIKRIEIASVLARRARLSLFDEPEAGIDLWSFKSLIEVFSELRGKLDGSLLIISHQERILAIADEIVVIAGGRVRMHGPRDAVLPALLAGEAFAGCPRVKEDA
jgi:Fe-S cluster assembly ATP-binding protein